MGRPDKVIVSAETVVELAMCALVPIRCEVPVPLGPDDKRTQPCAQELSCWKSFYKHSIKKHSSKRKAQAHGPLLYHCGLNKCSAKMHSTSKAFRMHVETSHMKNVPFPCPFANCVPPIPQFGRAASHHKFMRERDLVGHLKLNHSDLIGCELDVRDWEKLLPSWEPRPPVRPLPVPPDLPSRVVPTVSLRLETVKPRDIRSVGWLARAEVEAAESQSQSQSQDTDTRAPSFTPVHIPATPGAKTPGGRRRLQRPTLAPSSPDRNTDLDYHFADLSTVFYDATTGGMQPGGILGPPHFVVQPVDVRMRVDLVSALPMREPPVRPALPPPTSIFHEALRKQVYAQYALGEEAATDSLAVAEEFPS
ncbi:hypothetical protein DFH07DRAFT_302942 [Mycena maculata]|uniref:C2H2-type domain-containing protein n=1 Tax=Mycena maculata TaxID=230809 RepID=A0AAD7HHZ8_9AGAR|nr:hypothetical protein DFH07DRAFT_302942 [Mycena maculata]